MTKLWYKETDHYNYAKGEAKKTKTYKDVEHLTAMLWLGGGADDKDFAAYAIQDGCAAARFCNLATPGAPPGGSNVNHPSTAKAYKTNVLKRCIDDNGVDTCFTKEQRDAINKQRLLRKGTKVLKEDNKGDQEIAKAIKNLMASTNTSKPTTLAKFTEELDK
jgi:hypothetical protein